MGFKVVEDVEIRIRCLSITTGLSDSIFNSTFDKFGHPILCKSSPSHQIHLSAGDRL